MVKYDHLPYNNIYCYIIITLTIFFPELDVIYKQQSNVTTTYNIIVYIPRGNWYIILPPVKGAARKSRQGAPDSLL